MAGRLADAEVVAGAEAADTEEGVEAGVAAAGAAGAGQAAAAMAEAVGGIVRSGAIGVAVVVLGAGPARGFRPEPEYYLASITRGCCRPLFLCSHERDAMAP